MVSSRQQNVHSAHVLQQTGDGSTIRLEGEPVAPLSQGRPPPIRAMMMRPLVPRVALPPTRLNEGRIDGRFTAGP